MWIYLLLLLVTGYAQGDDVVSEPADPAMDNDGSAEVRIVGGEVAPEKSRPWQASLTNVKGQKYHFCGGSVIHKNWILTAAHCTKGRDKDSFEVLVGTNKLSSGGQSYKVDSIYIYEKYINNSVLTDDLSLVKVANEIEFSDSVKTIEISGDQINAGQKCTVSGWGYVNNYRQRTDTLEMLEVTTLSESECKKRLSEVGPAIYTNQICTYDGYNKGFCQGDSGGPLICSGKLSGCVSWNAGGCGRGYPDVYTRLSEYVDWINETLDEK